MLMLFQSRSQGARQRWLPPSQIYLNWRWTGAFLLGHLYCFTMIEFNFFSSQSAFHFLGFYAMRS